MGEYSTAFADFAQVGLGIAAFVAGTRLLWPHRSDWRRVRVRRRACGPAAWRRPRFSYRWELRRMTPRPGV